mmetsp:Transcript_36567/g.66299  ORF Transcript_36567/g.66299 Transcript_36567/m.66299 type:complete len:773 (+) Transcript_36567:75-2393(+)
MAKKGKRKEARPVPVSKSERGKGGGGGDFPELGASGHRGLENLGNTCYLNSVLQCLNVSNVFSDEVIDKCNDGLAGLSASLISIFRGIRGESVTCIKAGSVSPKSLLGLIVQRFPWYQGRQQQDAHELLRTLIGSVSEELDADERKAAKAAGKTPVPRVPGPSCGMEQLVWQSFRGHFFAAVLCWNCRRISVRRDPFLDVSLELPGELAAVGSLGVTSAHSLAAEKSASSSSGAPSKNEAEKEEAESSKKMSKKEKKRMRAEAKAEKAPAASELPPAAGAPGWNFFSKPSVGSWYVPLRRGLGQASHQHSVEVTSKKDSSEAVEEIKDAVAGSEEPEPECFEIELRRDNKKKEVRWGFGWCEESLANDELVLQTVHEDSVLDKWNLKKRSIGDEELVLRPGDRIIAIQGQSDIKQMRRAMKMQDELSLTISRSVGARNVVSHNTQAASESDKDDEEERMEMGARRAAFLEAARRCEAELPEDLAEVFCKSTGSAKQVNGSCQLMDCFEHFMSTEALADEFRPNYQCGECCKESSAGSTAKKAQKPRSFACRKTWLSTPLPPILTLHFKRFRRRADKWEKTSGGVDLPDVLDVSNCILTEDVFARLKPHLASDCSQDAPSPMDPSDLRYELYGLCVHQGKNLGSGHYVAYVNAGSSLGQEKWYNASDTHVSRCSREDALKAEPYLAFYRRIKDLKEVDDVEEGSAEKAEKKWGPKETQAAEDAVEQDEKEEDEEGEEHEEEAEDTEKEDEDLQHDMNDFADQLLQNGTIEVDL